ncbi:MAG: flavin reductase [Clostridia bacterium]|nr:flavin reductase [Clostridia bacterium]
MKRISPCEIKENAVKLISQDWGLLSAGNKDAWNTMTVSWGMIGELWGKDVAAVFVRPQRHTKKFIDENEYFSLCFFNEEYKDALKICGSKSGRDIDKAAATGLVPRFDENAVYFEQAKLVVICKKISSREMSPQSFADESINNNYPAGDYHTTYIGEIVTVLEK